MLALVAFIQSIDLNNLNKTLRTYANFFKSPFASSLWFWDPNISTIPKFLLENSLVYTPLLYNFLSFFYFCETDDGSHDHSQ